MKTKNFFLTAALVLATALTGTMMTSCSKIDIPVADNDGNPPVPKGKTVKLDTLSADYVAEDGDILTGTLKNWHKLSIAEGATVTLSDVITQIHDDTGITFPGITCEGNATIVLADGTVNELIANQGQPGILAGGKGTTLIIRGGEKGSGKLTATGRINAAGIGSGCDMTCGDIKIKGGHIEATGGDYAAGIGTGRHGRCGIITIEGGVIEANGGKYAAGIGTGRDGICGNIIISKPATGMATGGEYSPWDIGAGKDGMCSYIFIDEETIDGKWDDNGGEIPIVDPNGGGGGDSPIGGDDPIIVHTKGTF